MDGPMLSINWFLVTICSYLDFVRHAEFYLGIRISQTYSISFHCFFIFPFRGHWKGIIRSLIVGFGSCSLGKTSPQLCIRRSLWSSVGPIWSVILNFRSEIACCGPLILVYLINTGTFGCVCFHCLEETPRVRLRGSKRSFDGLSCCPPLALRAPERRRRIQLKD